MKEIVFWDVDTQNDFFDQPFSERGEVWTPRLAVPGAGELRANLKQLTDYAMQRGYKLMGTVDAHTGDDSKHLAKWGAHCIKGTPGQQKVLETIVNGTGFVPIERIARNDAVIVNSKTPVYFEKRELPAAKDADESNSWKVNANVLPVLEQIKPALIAVYGVVLGYCVKEAVEPFLDKGYKVALVTDAIKEFSADELTLYADWKKRGATLVHTRDVLAGKLKELV